MGKIASLYDLTGFEAELGELAPQRVTLATGAPDEMIDKLAGFEYIIASGERYDRDVIAALAARGLKMIQRLGVGYDQVDVEAARDNRIVVANTPGANANAVAEHALMLTLAAARGAGENNRAMHAGEWTRTRPRDLTGATFGLVGFGHIARRYAELIRPLAGRILACDPYAAGYAGIEARTLDELVSCADVISLHLPLTRETRGLFGRETFAKLKPGCIFVNTSRGEIVDEYALAEALRDARVFAAGLDVFQTEPPDGASGLRDCPNCFMTPHNASLTNAAFKSMVSFAADEIASHMRGDGAPHSVNCVS